MKLIIAGNRELKVQAKFIIRHLNDWGVGLGDVTEVVSGKARGVDTSGEEFARLHDIPIKEFPAEWDTYGLSAGDLRNEQMGRYADRAILFFKRRPSRGTSNMLAWMACLGKPYHVVVV